MAGEIMEERILELMTAFKGLNNSDMLEGCSQSEFNTLVTIEQIEAEKVNVNKIAESLKVSMPAVSKTLKNLFIPATLHTFLFLPSCSFFCI